MRYELIDIEIDASRIEQVLDAGIVQFDRDYESRFRSWTANIKPLSST